MGRRVLVVGCEVVGVGLQYRIDCQLTGWSSLSGGAVPPEIHGSRRNKRPHFLFGWSIIGPTGCAN